MLLGSCHPSVRFRGFTEFTGFGRRFRSTVRRLRGRNTGCGHVVPERRLIRPVGRNLRKRFRRFPLGRSRCVLRRQDGRFRSLVSGAFREGIGSGFRAVIPYIGVIVCGQALFRGFRSGLRMTVPGFFRHAVHQALLQFFRMLFIFCFGRNLNGDLPVRLLLLQCRGNGLLHRLKPETPLIKRRKNLFSLFIQCFDFQHPVKTIDGIRDRRVSIQVYRSVRHCVSSSGADAEDESGGSGDDSGLLQGGRARLPYFMKLDFLSDVIVCVRDTEHVPRFIQSGGLFSAEIDDDSLHVVPSFRTNFRYSESSGKSPSRIRMAIMIYLR